MPPYAENKDVSDVSPGEGDTGRSIMNEQRCQSRHPSFWSRRGFGKKQCNRRIRLIAMRCDGYDGVTFVQARQERITIWEGIFQVQIAFPDRWEVDQEIPGVNPKVTAGRKRNLLIFQMTSPVNRFDITGIFTYICSRLKTNFLF
jgi:hypothetical protein